MLRAKGRVIVISANKRLHIKPAYINARFTVYNKMFRTNKDSQAR